MQMQIKEKEKERKLHCPGAIFIAIVLDKETLLPWCCAFVFLGASSSHAHRPEVGCCYLVFVTLPCRELGFSLNRG